MIKIAHILWKLGLASNDWTYGIARSGFIGASLD